MLFIPAAGSLCSVAAFAAAGPARRRSLLPPSFPQPSSPAPRGGGGPERRAAADNRRPSGPGSRAQRRAARRAGRLRATGRFPGPAGGATSAGGGRPAGRARPPRPAGARSAPREPLPATTWPKAARPCAASAAVPRIKSCGRGGAASMAGGGAAGRPGEGPRNPSSFPCSVKQLAVFPGSLYVKLNRIVNVICCLRG